MKYILRLLGLPFFAGLLAIGFIFQFFLKLYLWIRYGGEAINYNDKMNRKTISDVFYRVQEVSSKSEVI
jgi:hypothetical protein